MAQARGVDERHEAITIAPNPNGDVGTQSHGSVDVGARANRHVIVEMGVVADCCDCVHLNVAGERDGGAEATPTSNRNRPRAFRVRWFRSHHVTASPG
jgi:hypothetical protein